MLSKIIDWFIGAAIATLVTFIVGRIHTWWINRKSLLAGTWGQFIYEKEDIDCKNTIIKRDEYIISEASPILHPKPFKTNINGSIFRIKDASTTTISTSEKRKWECTGYCDYNMLMLFYKGTGTYHTKGCVYTKATNVDHEYKGYYLANHTQVDGSERIDMTPVILRQYLVKYALFDWDKTISKDYTVFPWIEYLCRERKFDTQIKKKIDIVTADYQNGRITHDQYAEQVGFLYAEGLSGVKSCKIDSLAQKYVADGNLPLYPNIKDLFKTLHKRKIKIIIVSGAPFEIVKCYQNEFQIDAIYALKAEIVEGVYTGKVETNFGFNKHKIVERIIQENDKTPPYMAFGDSESDYPMLNIALYPFYISNVSNSQTNEFILVDRNNVTKQIIKKIR